MHKTSIAFLLLALASSPAQAEQIFLTCSEWVDAGEEEVIIDTKSKLVVRLAGEETFTYNIRMASDHRIVASTERLNLNDAWYYTNNKEPNPDDYENLWVEVDINRITGRAVYNLYAPIPRDLRKSEKLQRYAMVVGSMIWKCKKAPPS
ncbi:MAG: hypothetical protein ACE5K1_10625 [Acidiferrobacterales bacterium]